MFWDIVLERRTKNRLHHENTRRKLRETADLTQRAGGLGFRARVGKIPEPSLVFDRLAGQEVWRYEVKVRLERTKEPSEEELASVLSVLRRLAASDGWSVPSLAPAVGEVAAKKFVPRRPPFVAPDLTEDAMKTFFAHVYEREPHIRLIHDAVKSYAESLRAWQEDNSLEIARSHVLLKGKPAAAKTMLFERMKSFLEQGGGVERVTFVDMQTATKAGLENWLLERAEQRELAEIIVLEEIEKVKPLDALLPLVSIMGSGYLAKLNAVIGHKKEIANVLVFATCNDEGIIRNWRRGVLWSRFPKRLHCKRPSPELMHRILLDKIAKMHGNPLWADKVMDFGYRALPEEMGLAPMDDPRALLGMLDGRDRLLDEGYQADLLHVIRDEIEEGRADLALAGKRAV